VPYGTHIKPPPCLVRLALSAREDNSPARRRALRVWLALAGELRELDHPATLAAEEEEVPKEEVKAGSEAL
jgi:hypothetical protein